MAIAIPRDTQLEGHGDQGGIIEGTHQGMREAWKTKCEVRSKSPTIASFELQPRLALANLSDEMSMQLIVTSLTLLLPDTVFNCTIKECISFLPFFLKNHLESCTKEEGCDSAFLKSSQMRQLSETHGPQLE